MKVRKIVILLIACMCFTFFITNKVFATDSNLDQIIQKMEDVHNVDDGDTDGKVGQVLNAIIRLIQVAGTGVSVIVVTMLGGKYMIASASEKADLKKSAIPVVIGCILLFVASNLVAIIADVATGFNS